MNRNGLGNGNQRSSILRPYEQQLDAHPSNPSGNGALEPVMHARTLSGGLQVLERLGGGLTGTS